MIGIQATITGERRIRDWTRGLADGFHKRATELVTSSAFAIEKAAKRLAPVKDNFLKPSIHTDLDVGPDEIRARVGTDVEHAHYVEYGTGLHGPKGRAYEIKPKTKKALAFAAQAGTELATGRALFRSRKGGLQRSRTGAQRVVVRKVIHPGIRPQPYMGPAFDHYVPQFRRDLSQLAEFGFPRT